MSQTPKTLTSKVLGGLTQYTLTRYRRTQSHFTNAEIQQIKKHCERKIKTATENLRKRTEA